MKQKKTTPKERNREIFWLYYNILMMISTSDTYNEKTVTQHEKPNKANGIST